MHKHPNVLLNLCLSSLVFTVSMVATTAVRISATEAHRSIPTITKIAQADPCAGKADPCAGKADPCAGKLGSVGGPLAKELQGKPVVVDVYASWCAGCKNIAPTLSQLKQEYAGKVNFVILDVTDKGKLTTTEAKSKKLGLGKFLAANKSKTSTVAIVDPATGNILALYKNNPTKSDYTKVLNTALAKK
jgi:thiol-disulfide isomerase/thioredoxin